MRPAYGAGVSSVLVIEDDAAIRSAVTRVLRERGHVVTSAATGMGGLQMAVDDAPDAVLLDLGLPDVSGLQVLAMLRAVSDVPVVVVTARDEDAVIVQVLDAGADDYVVKPFRPREVMARVKAVLRRASARTEGEVAQVYRIGKLEIDTGAVMARLDGHTLTLTPAEFRLLACMAHAPGRAFTRSELLAAALPESEALERVVDAHLASARRKLEAAGGSGLLQTVRGVGYRLSENG